MVLLVFLLLFLRDNLLFSLCESCVFVFQKHYVSCSSTLETFPPCKCGLLEVRSSALYEKAT